MHVILVTANPHNISRLVVTELLYCQCYYQAGRDTMRGPIDYIVVGFEGPKFDGSILAALSEAIDKGIIKLIALAAIRKDEAGTVELIDITQTDNEVVASFLQAHPVDANTVEQDDIDEVADLLENDTAAGLLIVEQLWAIPLKKALIDAGGVLVAEGRIHPDAAFELESKEG